MKTKLHRVTLAVALLGTCGVFAQIPNPPPQQQQPPPAGNQPPPLNGAPPPNNAQPPQGAAQPPQAGALPPQPGMQPPPAGAPPQAPVGNPPPAGDSRPPVAGNPPLHGGAPPPPNGNAPALNGNAAVPGGNPPPGGNVPPPQPRPPQQQPPPPQGAPGGLGGPLAGLTADELAAFNAGRREFVERETRAGGLGPIFNDVSCVACHRAPAPGGASRIFVTRFGQTTDGVFDPLEDLGGSLLQNRAIQPAARERIPLQANTRARRQTTPLFGLGLIEAIPDQTLLDLAARPEVDGVSGRAALVIDVASGEQRVGRFGWKAQQATLLAFSGDAYLNEMGITNRLFPEENAPNGDAALLARFDTVPDPEDEDNAIDALADFQRLLAPPQPLVLTANAAAGRALFSSVGCAQCHVPELQTGPSDVAALSGKTVALYSDLLLHDMGALGDGIAQADAAPNEFRTPPLWGLRASAPYLHDGRAGNVDQAIRGHDGEGRIARDRYNALSPAQKAQLAEFLRSL